MRSYVPARPAHEQDAAAAGRVGDQFVAGKVMGLPGGRGSPIERLTVTAVRPRAQALRLTHLAASTASHRTEPGRPLVARPFTGGSAAMTMGWAGGAYRYDAEGLA